jgi:hypothetical protein
MRQTLGEERATKPFVRPARPSAYRRFAAAIMPSRFVRCVVAVICALVAGQGRAADDPPGDTSWPAVTAECRPWTRWWWLGNAVDEPRPPRSNWRRSPRRESAAWRSPRSMEPTGPRSVKFGPTSRKRRTSALAFTCTGRAARRLGLGVDMATGTGWPFGRPHVGFRRRGILEPAAPQGGRRTPAARRRGIKVKRSPPREREGFVVNPYSAGGGAAPTSSPFSTAAFAALPKGPHPIGQFHDSFEYYNGEVGTRGLPRLFRALHGYALDSARLETGARRARFRSRRRRPASEGRLSRDARGAPCGLT